MAPPPMVSESPTAQISKMLAGKEVLTPDEAYQAKQVRQKAAKVVGWRFLSFLSADACRVVFFPPLNPRQPPETIYAPHSSCAPPPVTPPT